MTKGMGNAKFIERLESVRLEKAVALRLYIGENIQRVTQVIAVIR